MASRAPAGAQQLLLQLSGGSAALHHAATGSRPSGTVNRYYTTLDRVGNRRKVLAVVACRSAALAKAVWAILGLPGQ